MTMHVSERGLQLIENFEGFSSVRYLDSVGTPTLGFGSTAADISPLPSRCTRAQAEGWLAEHLRSKYEPAVNALSVPLNQNQFDALVSLAYNVGPGVMGWQIGRDLRARNYRAAADDFLHYVYAGGQVLQGLVNRRRAERALFVTAWVNPDPHHYALFDRTDRHLGGRTMNEHDTVVEYDRERAHWTRWPGRLGRLRENCGLLAGRIEEVAHEHGGMGVESRQFRHDGLVGRHDGRRYA